MIRLFTHDVLKSAKRRHRIILLMILAIFAGGATAHILKTAGLSPAKNIIAGNIFPETGSAVEGHLPNMTEEAISEQMQLAADKNYFAFKINGLPVFKDGTSEGSLHIENPGHNLYPFVVEIFLNETQENIYNSGGILPNHHINTGKLTKALPKGKYAATAYISAYDPETLEYSGKSAVELTITITS